MATIMLLFTLSLMMTHSDSISHQDYIRSLKQCSSPNWIFLQGERLYHLFRLIVLNAFIQR